jgi:hypothetical protein
LMALTKSLRRRGGSASWSPSISVHDISFASGSPGEQGVHFWTPSCVIYRCEYVSRRHMAGFVIGLRARGEGDVRVYSALRFGSSARVA